MVDHHIELRPGPELSLPVRDGGERSDDQEWPLNALYVYLIEECNGLDGLPEPHLVCQDTVTSADDGDVDRMKSQKQMDFRFFVFSVTEL